MKTKQIHQPALKTLETIKANAVKNQVTVTNALSLLLVDYPELTRREFRHTAEEAGINGLTARNFYDRARRDSK